MGPGDTAPRDAEGGQAGKAGAARVTPGGPRGAHLPSAAAPSSSAGKRRHVPQWSEEGTGTGGGQGGGEGMSSLTCISAANCKATPSSSMAARAAGTAAVPATSWTLGQPQLSSAGAQARPCGARTPAAGCLAARSSPCPQSRDAASPCPAQDRPGSKHTIVVAARFRATAAEVHVAPFPLPSHPSPSPSASR